MLYLVYKITPDGNGYRDGRDLVSVYTPEQAKEISLVSTVLAHNRLTHVNMWSPYLQVEVEENILFGILPVPTRA